MVTDTRMKQILSYDQDILSINLV